MRVEQARALRELALLTPEGATIWVWWDFGYAVQYFAQRHTIADGARHGGVHLYLPAAAYSTDNPHFAAQLIKYTANAGLGEGQAAEAEREAGPELPVADRANAVFAGLSGEDAQRLVESWAGSNVKLKDKSKPQYLVVSFDILRLGYWISNYGNWNFALREGKGYNISSISQALKYNVDDGIVSVAGRDPVEADSLDILGKAQALPEGMLRRLNFDELARRVGQGVGYDFSKVLLSDEQIQQAEQQQAAGRVAEAGATAQAEGVQ